VIIHNPKQADPPPPHTMTPREIVSELVRTGILALD
jgi:hypothetical protein